MCSASADGTCRLWPHGAWIGSKEKGTRGVSALAFCEDRQLIVLAIGRHVTVYNPTLTEKVITLSGHADTVESICASMPSLLVSADTAGNVRVYAEAPLEAP